MLKIRLSRQGAKKNPQYLVVVMDEASSRDGKCLERLGHYYPRETDPKAKIKVNLEKLVAWQSKGAQTTAIVSKLLKATTRV